MSELKACLEKLDVLIRAAKTFVYQTERDANTADFQLVTACALDVTRYVERHSITEAECRERCYEAFSEGMHAGHPLARPFDFSKWYSENYGGGDE